MEFTFFGDLLGTANLYRLDPTAAYEKLNSFYTTTFYAIDEAWATENKVRIILFSDSLMVWGKDAEGALDQISKVYRNLIYKGILLRGAMISKRLKFDPRFTRPNFEKKLPKDDTLARAVGLHGSKKGARFIVETSLANELLRQTPSWNSLEGYNRTPRVAGIDYANPLRRLCPNPDGDGFEVLYFWGPNRDLTHHITDYRRYVSELKQVKEMVNDELQLHYKETISLLKRCKTRQMFTEKAMPQPGGTP